MSFFVIFVLFSFSISSTVGFLCTETYCEDWLPKNPCPPLPENCLIQNATHNGLFLPYAGPCNCCDYCLENLDEDDWCALGGLTSPLPDTICGNLLACTEGESKEGTCKTLKSDCTNKQNEYDKRREDGTLGYMEVRPNCNNKGLYEPYTCVPGEICYCVDPYGERIFGEIPFTGNPELYLRCECSRSFSQAAKFMDITIHPVDHFRCLTNGDYDPIQCIDDECFCVHINDGLSSIEDQEMINSTLLELKTPPCFDKKLHLEGTYHKACAVKYLEALREKEELEEEYQAVLGFVPPNCQLDGLYAPVQQTGETKYCADPTGKPIEGYSILKTDVRFASAMDCKCVRARSIMTGIEKPECEANGNYKPMQCRRGVCRCVDSNGQQVGKEVDFSEKDKLVCGIAPK